MELTGNIFFDLFIAFGAGVLVSFTPCVYPVMPITAGFIAGFNAEGTKLRGFIISLIYVLGLALTYCAIAVFAALTGKLFGQLQNNPWMFVGVANLLLFFALVMMDVIALPSLGAAVPTKIKKRNLWTVLICGATAGLVIGPCTAPVLGALFGIIALKQRIVYGVILTFVFAYGVGASLILVGTFSGILGALPKSGVWLVRVKQFCGLVLIIAAQYFLIKAGGLM